ncbi:MAG: putative DNA binding domain-containing protein [Chloroflexi bacterium]|nr:putative DNA binding domain-containing protein [Chloroflexota bacterium]
MRPSGQPIEYLTGLIHELRKQPRETEWLEFKIDDDEPQGIGEYISALSNSATLQGKVTAYVLWGVTDSEHTIVGTHFLPSARKVGNEELESWLLRLLEPKILFSFSEIDIEGCRIVLLEIQRAAHRPVSFSGQEYIRIGQYKKKLKDFPEKERALWRIFDKSPFESGVVAERVTGQEVLKAIDYPSYFDLLKATLPETAKGILDVLASDQLICPCDAGGWNITNLGAILFAKDINSFRSLKRKAVRVIQYKGRDRTQTLKEQDGVRGYASAFQGLISYINGLLPSNEIVGQALRKTVPMFPERAVRELVANALIHQDFSLTGAGPMVEIFEDRIEFTNSGVPLVDPERFVDRPPVSRNETLASLLRRTGICEERGSGWDKVVFDTELYQLPAPLAEVITDHTRVVLYAHRSLTKMDKADKVRAVYLHACLRYVSRQNLTNTSVRERFGIKAKNIAMASRLIRDAVEAGLIAPFDLEAAPKLMRYVPYWANPRGEEAT